LLINAMQAMPGGGLIDVTIKADTDVLWVVIEDNGEGVPAAVSEKIWDPFFTTKEKGTGLGLGIVKNIIEAHEGTIQISNRRPKGTRVSIHFPLPEEGA
jgi:signal transduction histidine kinase